MKRRSHARSLVNLERTVCNRLASMCQCVDDDRQVDCDVCRVVLIRVGRLPRVLEKKP